jgi:hypothetical protein
MTLSELFAKLEEAEEGSRELSNTIAEAVGWERNDARSFVWKSTDGLAHHTAPDFSRSLDAALTLIPEGWHFRNVCQTGEGQWGCHVTDSIRFGVEKGGWYSAPGKTGPIALCIAALKARG